MPPYALLSLLGCLLSFFAGVLVARQIFQRRHQAERARLEEDMLNQLRPRLEAYTELESQVMRIFERLNEIESETAQGLALSDERLRNLNNALSAVEGRAVEAGELAKDPLDDLAWMGEYLEDASRSDGSQSGPVKVVPIEVLEAQRAESAAHEMNSIAQWQDRFEAMRQEKHAEIERQGALITQLTERLSRIEPRADITKRLEVEMVTWQNKYRELQDETAVEIAGLRAQVRDKQAGVQQLPELESKLAQLEAASEQLRSEKDKVIAELEARAAELEQRAAELEALASAQGARAAEYEARAADLEPSVSALEDARAEVAQWQQRCEQEIERRELELAGLRARVDELEPMENTIEFLWEDKAALERTLAEKRHELDEAQARGKQQAQYLNAAREALAALESDYGELSARASSLEASSAGLEGSQAHIAELEQRLADERARIAALEQQLEAQAGLVMERELEVERWKNECEDAGRQCADWEQRLCKFEQDKHDEVMSLQSHVELLEPLLARVSTFEQLVVDLESRERKGRARITELEVESQRLTAELQQRSLQCGESNGRLEEVERELGETATLLSRAAEQHARELTELQGRLQDYADQLTAAQACQAELERGLHEKSERIQGLEGNLSSQQVSFSQLQSETEQRLRVADEQHAGELAELRGQIEHYSNELAAAQAQQAELGGWNAEQAERVRTLEAELQSLRDSYAEHQVSSGEQQRQAAEQHAGELAELRGLIEQQAGELAAARGRRDELAGLNHEQAERVLGLEDELTALRASYAEYQAGTDDLQRRTAEQHAGELAELRGLIEQQAGELAAAQARQAELEGKNREQAERVRGLERELSVLQVRYDEYHASSNEHHQQTAEGHARELAGLRDRIENYIAELASARARQGELQSRSDEQTERVRNLKGELTGLRTHFAAYQTSTDEQQRRTAEQHSSELAELRRQIDQHLGELAGARTRQAELERQNHGQAEQVRGLEGELASLRASYADHQAEADGRQRQIAEQHASELAGLRGRIEQHVAELAEARARQAELEDLNQEQAERVRGLEGELSGLRASYAEYQSNSDERVQLTAEQHAGELADLNGRVRQVTEELAAAQQRQDELESQNREQAERVLALQGELSTQRASFADLQAELDRRLGQAEERHAAELGELQGRLQGYVGELASAQAKLSELTGQHREKDCRVQVLERELAEQGSRCTQLKVEIGSLMQDIVAKRSKIESLQVDLQGKTDLVETLMEQLEMAAEEGNRVRRDVEKKRELVEAAESVLAELRPKLEALETQLQTEEPHSGAA